MGICGSCIRIAKEAAIAGNATPGQSTDHEEARPADGAASSSAQNRNSASWQTSGQPDIVAIPERDAGLRFSAEILAGHHSLNRMHRRQATPWPESVRVLQEIALPPAMSDTANCDPSESSSSSSESLNNEWMDVRDVPMGLRFGLHSDSDSDASSDSDADFKTVPASAGAMHLRDDQAQSSCGGRIDAPVVAHLNVRQSGLRARNAIVENYFRPAPLTQSMLHRLPKAIMRTVIDSLVQRPRPEGMAPEQMIDAILQIDRLSRVDRHFNREIVDPGLKNDYYETLREVRSNLPGQILTLANDSNLGRTEKQKLLEQIMHPFATLSIDIGRVRKSDDRDALISALGSHRRLRQLELNGIVLPPSEHMDIIVSTIVSNPGLGALKLSDACLDEAAMGKLMACLATNTTIKDFHLLRSLIHNNQGCQIADMLRVNRSLERLDLNHNWMAGQPMLFMARALSENRHLTHLNLGDSHLKDGDIVPLVDGLRKNSTLQELFLDENEIRDGGAHLLAELLETNSAIQCLSMRNNVLGMPGARELRLMADTRPGFILDVGKSDLPATNTISGN